MAIPYRVLLSCSFLLPLPYRRVKVGGGRRWEEERLTRPASPWYVTSRDTFLDALLHLVYLVPFSSVSLFSLSHSFLFACHERPTSAPCDRGCFCPSFTPRPLLLFTFSALPLLRSGLLLNMGNLFYLHVVHDAARYLSTFWCLFSFLFISVLTCRRRGAVGEGHKRWGLQIVRHDGS